MFVVHHVIYKYLFDVMFSCDLICTYQCLYSCKDPLAYIMFHINNYKYLLFFRYSVWSMSTNVFDRVVWYWDFNCIILVYNYFIFVGCGIQTLPGIRLSDMWHTMKKRPLSKSDSVIQTFRSDRAITLSEHELNVCG